MHCLLRHGYRGAIYPVNPKYDEIAGRPAFPDVAAIGQPVDLALLLVPATAVVDQLTALGAIGASAAVVFASGFAESGGDGAALQRRMVAEARRHGIRLLGPNCQGVIDMRTGFAATFTGAAEEAFIPADGVAYVGQSGAIGGSLLDLAREAGMGLTAWVSTGNEADIDSLEVAQFLLERDDVRTVLLYLESSPDPVRYAELGSTATTMHKHVVCLRTGRTAAGQRAVASHTGAIIAPDLAFRLLSDRHGIVLADDLDDLVRVGQHVTTSRRPAGRGIAVVSTSGGAGSLAADVLSEHGWDLPTLEPRTQDRLRELVPEFGATSNPVDVTAQLFSRSGARFPQVCAVVLADDAVDVLVILVTMATGEFGRELAEYAVAVRNTSDKPVHFVWMAGRALTIAGREVLIAGGMPVYASVTDLSRTLARVQRVGERRGETAGAPAVPPDVAVDVGSLRRRANRAGMITEWTGASLLDVFGIARPAGALVRNAAEARRAAGALEGPLVCKLQSAALTHKSDSGALRLGVSVDEVGDVVTQLLAVAADLGIPDEDIEGVLVQAMAPPGVELLVSVLGGEQGFPPVATVGFGGVAAELDPDVVSFLLPAAREDIVAGLRSLRRGALLFGYRGRAPVDVPAVLDVIDAVAAMTTALRDDLVELEINPLVVYPRDDGAVALDLVVRLSPHPAKGGTSR